MLSAVGAPESGGPPEPDAAAPPAEPEAAIAGASEGGGPLVRWEGGGSRGSPCDHLSLNPDGCWGMTIWVGMRTLGQVDVQ